MSTFNVDGVMVDIPGVVIHAEVPDEQLVTEAIAAREKAEATEEEASPARWREADRYAELHRRGWSHRNIATACGSNHTSVGVMCRMVDTYVSTEERPTFWQGYQEHRSDAGRSGNGSQVSNNSGDNEWFTPELYIEAARRVMGGIDLDPASDPLANETVRAGRFYTREDNGLTQPWFGRVWMNPPYRRGQDKDSVYPFAVRMADAVANDEVEQAIVLVNGAIETAWFHIMGEVASAICLVRKRIKFWHPDKPEADSPLQGQVFLYFGADLKAFRDEFTEFGWVLEPSA